MKKNILISSLLLLSFEAMPQRLVEYQVSVPSVGFFGFLKQDFISKIADISHTLFPAKFRVAIAPFGGVKVTPFLELDLDQLIIVTNSYPGTAHEINNEFRSNSEALTLVLNRAISQGSMSTTDVISVNIGAQIISRLKLELGVSHVDMSYWSKNTQSNFSDREMQSHDEAVVTIFDFVHQGRSKRLVFISAFIQSDSATNMKVGFPELVKNYIPSAGLDWVYLSADGLGHFSAHPNSGLQVADRELMDFLSNSGAIILDYPTNITYHSDQFFGGIHFMQGRRNLEEMNFNRIATLPVESIGLFGYCIQTGDEVRVYQKNGHRSVVSTPVRQNLVRSGPVHRFNLLK